MLTPIIGTKKDPDTINALIDVLESTVEDEAQLYVGYPIASTADSAVTIPALLISSQAGVICIDVRGRVRSADVDEILAERKQFVLGLKAKLIVYDGLADSEANLAFRVTAVTFSLSIENPDTIQNHGIVNAETLPDFLRKQERLDARLLPLLNAAIERVANLRPKSLRASVQKDDSLAAKLKYLEAQIANLDSFQKGAAIENPLGPQRIRGLAGSGKTVVLALKAAYLHGAHPAWKIGVTFHTRSLKQQFDGLINRFYYEDFRSPIDESLLQIVHSYGSAREPGIYSIICSEYNVPPRTFGYGKRSYGYKKAFQGVCRELLEVVESSPRPIFDALLIDEAQDLPMEFLRLAYLVTRNHRIVWAYDELQNLGDYELRSLKDIFGVSSDGEARVALSNRPKEPKQDIILPKCYRNPPWILAAAHAFGSGIFRNEGLVQHPDDPTLWEDIGYRVVEGDLRLGAKVVLERSPDATPPFFADRITADESLRLFRFNDENEQFRAVARLIAADIHEGELYPHDIAVVFPDALGAEQKAIAFSQHLDDQGVDSHVVGVTSSRDAFVMEGCVALSGPFRAKGNEAAMIYVMDADFCARGAELIKKRNILFTAMTRSRAWVRLCGTGKDFSILQDEEKHLRENNFRLKFTVPTREELAGMRKQYRDMNEQDRRQSEGLKKAVENVLADPHSTRLILETLPPEMRSELLRHLKQADDE